jgi:hypothetical protein
VLHRLRKIIRHCGVGNLPDESKAEMTEFLLQKAPKEIDSKKVEEVSQRDGVKYIHKQKNAPTVLAGAFSVSTLSTLSL